MDKRRNRISLATSDNKQVSGFATLRKLQILANRRAKVIEHFPGEGSVMKLLYYLLKEENDNLRSRALSCKDEWEKFVKSRDKEVATGRHTLENTTPFGCVNNFV
ncbi:hypothetical protein [Desulfurobacterium indicum]|uniref:Uncharacterized protein n=1 Tax=Desulfurobacterium indicum TaxID=1914305 RepID=A0A1R1MJR1_9BACT|nr:hypothetical protein [Desulfurobacterium indicum]OMH40003.1 hypothetical protein BLW93_07470 [Desulfurobacterium indicum]